MEKAVKDIMIYIDKHPRISSTSSVKDAVAELIGALRSGTCFNNTPLLVMEKNNLVGLLGIKEIMQAINPVVFKEGIYRGWSTSDEWSQPLFLKGLFTEKSKEISDLRVSDIMRPADQFLSLSDNLLKALHVLTLNGFEAVPVWHDGRVAGMVGVMEIMNEIAAIQTENDPGMEATIKQAAV
ncbi:MAG: CBS domain-containing protein [Bacillota bacterium]